MLSTVCSESVEENSSNIPKNNLGHRQWRPNNQISKYYAWLGTIYLLTDYRLCMPGEYSMLSVHMTDWLYISAIRSGKEMPPYFVVFMFNVDFLWVLSPNLFWECLVLIIASILYMFFFI